MQGKLSEADELIGRGATERTLTSRLFNSNPSSASSGHGTHNILSLHIYYKPNRDDLQFLSAASHASGVPFASREMDPVPVRFKSPPIVFIPASLWGHLPEGSDASSSEARPCHTGPRSGDPAGR